MLVDLRGRETTGKDLENRLDSIGITVNKNAVPNDPRKPSLTSGIRVGTPAATTRGLVEEDFIVVADIITAAIGDDFEEKKEELRAKVAAICAKYPLYN
jgi:glycine hydroxymethyltransferase